AGDEIGGFAAHKGSFPERGCRPRGDRVNPMLRSGELAGPGYAPATLSRRLGVRWAPARLTRCLRARQQGRNNPGQPGAARASAPFPVLRATFAVGVREGEGMARDVDG